MIYYGFLVVSNCLIQICHATKTQIHSMRYLLTFILLFNLVFLCHGQGYKKGSKVEVNVRAYWYKATVLDQKEDLFYVNYDGYSAAENQWVHKSQVRGLAPNGEAVTITCNYTPPPGNFTNSSPASDALFKREIYDYYARTVNGTLSRPTRIGIVFTTYSRGATYKNTVTNVPGQGATRKHEGAPVNAIIYTAATTYFVCEDYPSGVTQKQVNANFSFFINKDGEWTCSKDN